jgi:hypothetical protein
MKVSAPTMAPTGSMSEPSQMRTRCTRSVGRTKFSSGPTTVGPETTRMAPSMIADCLDMPSRTAAETVASAQVMGTPMMMSRRTTRRVWPCSLARSSWSPLSNKMIAHRERDQGPEQRPQELVGVDHLGQGPGGEPDRQQHDQSSWRSPHTPRSLGHKAVSGSNLRTRFGLVITQME